jgi:hypothetical protein
MGRSDQGRSVAGLFLSAAVAAAAGCVAGTAPGPDAPQAPAAASDTAIVQDASLVPPHPLPERDEPVRKPRQPKAPLFDNIRCFACHANYQDEPLVAFHAGGGVGCEKCHGESKTHTNDEDNLTAPEIMYGRDRINAACLECHPGFKFDKTPRPVGKVAPGPVVCTDCHFQHRLLRRDRVWDKKTGKLLSAPPVNRMTGTSP